MSNSEADSPAVVSLGDRGHHVRDLQVELNRHAVRLRMANLTVDGHYGGETAVAVGLLGHKLGVLDLPDPHVSMSEEVYGALLDLSKRTAAQLREAERRQLAIGPDLRPEHYIRGAVMLKLIGDWNSWVHRRVESFTHGDDYTFRRSRTVDFTVAEAFAFGDPATPVDMTVPLTLAHKWRLPRFDIRDEAGKQVPLLPRSEHGPIAAGALIAMAYQTVSHEVPPNLSRLIPSRLECDLRAIVHEQAPRALSVCDRLAAVPEGAESAKEEAEWRRILVTSEPFMELAWELAQQFVVMIHLRSAPELRRVITMSYEWQGAVQRSGFASRWRARVEDLVERTRSDSWPVCDGEARTKYGRISIAVHCADLAAMSADDGPVVCADVEVTSPGQRVKTFPLPFGPPALVPNLPEGRYALRPVARPGFQLLTSTVETVDVEGGKLATIEVQVEPLRFPSFRDLLSHARWPRVSLAYRITRGMGWRSQSTLIRLRLGEGGSYHFDYSAPAGLRVTRAKIADDVQGERDIQLRNAQRAHLYLPKAASGTATGYALLNIRPRAETLVRATSLTGVLTTLSIGGTALHWWLMHEPPPETAALLLGVPGGLSAYFTQTVADRVTYDLVFGLRLLGILPGIFAFASAAALLLGDGRCWALGVLGVLALLTAAVTLCMLTTACFISWPPEQRNVAGAQSPAFRERYLR